MFERQAEVLDLIQLESGKVRAHAYEEVADVAMVSAYYARTAGRHLADQRRGGALPGLTRTVEVRHPKGVVGFIAPWNYPLSMSITDAIPALMAGNACVIKPAQTTPFTALWIVDVLVEAGVPREVLSVVTGKGSALGTPMIEQCDFVTFTGSTEVGRSVAAQAGEQLIGCALELGGKNASIVLDDADLDKAVAGSITGCFASAGQLCISIERLYVPRSIVEEFTRRFVAAVEDLVLSPALAYGGDMGSLQSRDQLETVTRHVDDARAKGATVLTGGQPRPDVGPLFYAPTVLTGVDDSMAVATEETFGPVVTHLPLRRRRRGRRAGQRLRLRPQRVGVDRRTRERGAEVARRVQAGTVNVNESYAAAWASDRRPDGRLQGLGPRPAPRPRGHLEVHRGADHRDPAPDAGHAAAACSARRPPRRCSPPRSDALHTPSASPASDPRADEPDLDSSAPPAPKGTTMATPTIFFTGFPGFLGVELLPRVLRRNPEAEAVCLVQDKFLDTARAKVVELEKADAGPGRSDPPGHRATSPRPTSGSRPSTATLAETTTEVFHLAAVYDLAVAEDLGHAGQRRRHPPRRPSSPRPATTCSATSTCRPATCRGATSGRGARPTCRSPAMQFANHYDHTKHLAEVIVREAADAGLPDHDLPPRGRQRRLADRGDAEARRSVLRGQAAAQAARAGGRDADGRHAGRLPVQPRAPRLRGRRDQPPVRASASPRASPTPWPTPTRRRSPR